MKRILVIFPYFAAILLSANLYAQRGEDESRAELVALTVGFSDKVFYDVSVTEARAATKIWIKKLIESINQKVEDPGAKTIVFHDLPSIARALRAREADLLILVPLEYLELRKEVPLEPILTAIPGETLTYEYILLVRRDREFEDVDQLAGKELVMIDMWTRAAIPQFWLDTFLLKEGLPESRDFFSPVRKVDKNSQAVLLVFFGQADVCLVPLQTFKTMVELNPQLDRELVILARSPGFCYGLVCARQDVYEKFKDLIQEGLSIFSTDLRGQQLTTIFRLDELVPFQPDHLESVRKLTQEYEDLKPGLENRK